MFEDNSVARLLFSLSTFQELLVLQYFTRCFRAHCAVKFIELAYRMAWSLAFLVQETTITLTSVSQVPVRRAADLAVNLCPLGFPFYFFDVRYTVWLFCQSAVWWQSAHNLPLILFIARTRSKCQRILFWYRLQGRGLQNRTWWIELLTGKESECYSLMWTVVSTPLYRILDMFSTFYHVRISVECRTRVTWDIFL